MKRAKIRVLCLSLLVMLLSSTSMNASDSEPFVYDEASAMLSEVQNVDLLISPSDYNLKNINRATSLFYGACYEYKRVWVWSGWRPKRVWKWVRVDCPQAAPLRGPGTTIPPH